MKIEGREAQKFLDVVVGPKIFFSKRGILKLIFKIAPDHKMLWFEIFNFVPQMKQFFINGFLKLVPHLESLILSKKVSQLFNFKIDHF